MVQIPDGLRSLFSAHVDERDGSYVIEVPASEVEAGTLTPGETYRVGVFPLGGPGTDTGTGTAAEATEDGRGAADGPAQAPAPPVDEGEVRTVSIEALGDQGDGIAKVDRGYVVIVPGGEPGEEPTVRIEQVRQNVAFAEILDE
jgi:predicted RNA-binding protein with TRAM domain